jgi:hypothetical protein
VTPKPVSFDRITYITTILGRITTLTRENRAERHVQGGVG